MGPEAGWGNGPQHAMIEQFADIVTEVLESNTIMPYQNLVVEVAAEYNKWREDNKTEQGVTDDDIGKYIGYAISKLETRKKIVRFFIQERFTDVVTERLVVMIGGHVLRFREDQIEMEVKLHNERYLRMQ